MTTITSGFEITKPSPQISQGGKPGLGGTGAVPCGAGVVGATVGGFVGASVTGAGV